MLREYIGFTIISTVIISILFSVMIGLEIYTLYIKKKKKIKNNKK